MSVVASTVLTVLTVLSAADDQTPPPDDLVTPGVIGFFAIFAVAVATVFLGFDLVRRIRRTTYREQIRERLEAEAAEHDGQDGQGEQGEPTESVEPSEKPGTPEK
ncbi:hypothetical protein GCM10022381_15380 [Leifsonia kafniensis]|uniref:LapA family protein n=1 Tax=Leifsonia kafniensis TaxID=475957 RepID=A0ABP7KF22_9MICO